MRGPFKADATAAKHNGYPAAQKREIVERYHATQAAELLALNWREV